MRELHGLAAAGVIALALALPGCGGSTDDAAETAAGDEGSHALLDAVEEPLDRARAVEDITRDQKARLDEQIEDAGR